MCGLREAAAVEMKQHRLNLIFVTAAGGNSSNSFSYHEGNCIVCVNSH